MEINKKQLVLAFVMLLSGLGLGYMLFGGQTEVDEHAHGEHSTQQITYTCSMHPQIRQQEPGKCPLCGMDLTPLSSNGGDTTPGKLTMTLNAMKLAGIQTSLVDKKYVSKSISLSGKVAVREDAQFTIPAHFEGRIEKLHANVTGQAIKKGEPLAEVYSPELFRAHKEYIEVKHREGSASRLVQSSLQKLRLLRLDERTMHTLQQATRPVEVVTLYSPVDGFLMEKMVKEGDYFEAGMSLMSIMDNRHVWINWSASELDARWIREGDTILFDTPFEPGMMMQTTVQYVLPSLDEMSRTLTVRSVVPNKSNRLKPGMIITGTLQSSPDEFGRQLVIPASSVLWTGKHSLVYVQLRDKEVPTFELRKVTLGERVSEGYIVKNGLDEGELVVSHGAFRLDASAQLAGKRSMLQAEPEGTQVEQARKSISASATRDDLNQILDAYILVKDALVETDVNKTHQAVESFLTVLRSNHFFHSTEGAEVAQVYPDIQQALSAMKSANDVGVIRTHFEHVSDAIVLLARSFELDRTVYVQYCPMTFDFKGSNWLSLEEQIMNPYFGDEMLMCGEVTQVLR